MFHSAGSWIECGVLCMNSHVFSLVFFVFCRCSLNVIFGCFVLNKPIQLTIQNNAFCFLFVLLLLRWYILGHGTAIAICRFVLYFASHFPHLVLFETINQTNVCERYSFRLVLGLIVWHTTFLPAEIPFY